ncbi:centromere protein R isoform X2 [Varanus komodoensis]|uniref:centromere protein R isoform X2 n=1 Tax=Varanus komodoensis TaxID=61221 RepID=UPI001CF7DE3A|nr:centromere protein R isoform X2 [Varanus komodoensis]
MPVKRALKLDSHALGKVPATKLRNSKKNRPSYSSTTGTCLMSPFSSPESSNVPMHRNGQSNENRDESKDVLSGSSRKREPEIEENDKLLMLHSEVERTLKRFMQFRQNLTNLQALEGTKELENNIGITDNYGNLKIEVRKTRMLKQAKKQKLLKRSNIRLPTQDYRQSVSTFEFLKSLID